MKRDFFTEEEMAEIRRVDYEVFHERYARPEAVVVKPVKKPKRRHVTTPAQRAYMREYYRKNRERLRQRASEQYWADPEASRARQRQYYFDNVDRERERALKRYHGMSKEEKKRRREYKHAYYEAHKSQYAREKFQREMDARRKEIQREMDRLNKELEKIGVLNEFKTSSIQK